MGLSALYVESENGKKALRRGAMVPEGSRVLVVDDVLTTGTSVREVVELLQDQAEIVGIGVLIDRAQAELDLGAPIYAAHKVEANSYDPNEVPAWLEAIPITKPGTR
jgi:orotate phosphoribosyltransferase